MENFKRFLNEEKEMASDSKIEDIIIKVLNKEGGAAGLDPIKKALEGKVADDFDLVAFLKGTKDSMVKMHDKGDYIEMTGLKEAEKKRKCTGGKYDDCDGKEEKCDHVPCKDSKKKVKTGS